jgi:hypothetical protein
MSKQCAGRYEMQALRDLLSGLTPEQVSAVVWCVSFLIIFVLCVIFLKQKYYLFALLGYVGIFMSSADLPGVRNGIEIPYLNISAEDLGLFLGIGCCIIQIVIWLFALVRWMRAAKVTVGKIT